MKPLLPRMTLEEAAAAVTARAGEHWTARDVLGAAGRRTITVHAKLPHAMRMVRCDGDDSTTQEWTAVAGLLFPLDHDTANRLLVGPDVELTELHWIDAPVWRLAAGETAPRVTAADCWVVDSILERLIASVVDDGQTAAEAAAQATARARAAVSCRQDQIKKAAFLPWAKNMVDGGFVVRNIRELEVLPGFQPEWSSMAEDTQKRWAKEAGFKFAPGAPRK